MSWIYWGIVAGLVALVAMLVLCMDLLYSGGDGVSRVPGPVAGGSADAGTQPSDAGRRAA